MTHCSGVMTNCSGVLLWRYFGELGYLCHQVQWVLRFSQWWILRS